MLKKTVTYEGFDGEVTETLYFNLTRMDLLELNSRYDNNDMAAYLEKVVADKDVFKLYKVLKDIILLAYGVKSEDGKRFIKNEAVKNEFGESLAFAQLIEDLHDGDDALNTFINGLTSNIRGLNQNEGNK